MGDAFGERFFGDPDEVVARIRRRELPEDGMWQWTDDTAMAIEVTAELIERDGIDPDSLALRFAARYTREPWRGYGRGAHETLSAIAEALPWQEANRLTHAEGSKGNGSAMRAAPIGAYFADDRDALVRAARNSAVPTHVHQDAVDGGVAVALAAAYATGAAGSSPRGALLAAVIEDLPDGVIRDGLLQASELLRVSIERAAMILGTGHQVFCEDTVPFALWCADRHLDDYEEAMWTTVSGLGDRDTTCAIVGGIVTSGLGLERLPQTWLTRRESLSGRSSLTNGPQ